MICTAGFIRFLSSGGHRYGHSSGRPKPDLHFASALLQSGRTGCWMCCSSLFMLRSEVFVLDFSKASMLSASMSRLWLCELIEK